jgi:hypothetical protein
MTQLTPSSLYPLNDSIFYIKTSLDSMNSFKRLTPWAFKYYLTTFIICRYLTLAAGINRMLGKIMYPIKINIYFHHPFNLTSLSKTVRIKKKDTASDRFEDRIRWSIPKDALITTSRIDNKVSKMDPRAKPHGIGSENRTSSIFITHRRIAILNKTIILVSFLTKEDWVYPCPHHHLLDYRMNCPRE